MGSAFFEFNIAKSALFTAKGAVTVVSNNVANSATDGYSRQVAQIQASLPLSGTNGVGMIGTGSEIYGVGQIRDVYLDSKYWNQNSLYGEYEIKSSQSQYLETVFNELADVSITTSLDDFFDAVNDLCFDTDEDAYREALVSVADTLADNINTIAQNLQNLQTDLNDEIYMLVNQINSIGEQIATLNKQIFTYEINGDSANDLRDQRARLVDELSEYVNVEVKEETNASTGMSTYSVLINGQEFVRHSDVYELSCEKRTEKVNDTDAPGLYDVTWANGTKLNTNGLSGMLKGYLDMRDGNPNTEDNSLDYKGVAYYMDRLNTFVRSLASVVNEGETLDGTDIEGYDGHVNSYAKDGTSGHLFFSYTDENGNKVEGTLDYSQMNALNFCISKDIEEDSDMIAASDSSDVTEESNNNAISALLALKDDDSVFKEGNVYDYVNAISTVLGIDTKQAENFESYYESITTSIDNQRIEVSGVSLNEEAIDLIKFNQLYGAAAQLIAVINDIYDTTINELGI